MHRYTDVNVGARICYTGVMDEPLLPDVIDRPNRRPGEQFPDEIFTTARTLALSGLSSRQVAAQLRAEFPGQRTPTDRTIVEWRSREYSQDELEAANQAHLEIVRRTQSMILDDLEPDSKTQRPSTVALATIGGISMDKLLKQSDNTRPNVTVPIQIILHSPPPSD